MLVQNATGCHFAGGPGSSWADGRLYPTVDVLSAEQVGEGGNLHRDPETSPCDASGRTEKPDAGLEGRLRTRQWWTKSEVD